MMIRGMLFPVLGLFLMAAAVTAQAADLVVIAGGAPGLTPGQVIKSGASIEVPAGATVTLVSESGKTVTITGPHKGPANIGGGGSGGGDARLISSLSGLLTGSGKDTASLGTMRAAFPPKPPINPWVIDTGQSGDHCVPAKGPVTLWRAKSAKARILSIKNLKDKTKSKADWPAGASTVDWPAGVTLKDEGRYLTRLKGSRTARKFVLHLVPGSLPSDAHKAAWMAERGCVKQAKRLLAGLR